MQNRLLEYKSTIANGQSLATKGFNLNGCGIALIRTPGAITGTKITLAVSYDDVDANYKPLKKADGNEWEITVAADGVYNVTDLPALPWVKIRFGTAATPSAQGAERVVKVYSRLNT